MIDTKLTEMNAEFTNAATDILSEAAKHAGPLGKTRLRGAFTYVMAGLLADAVRQCEEDERLRLGVQMDDSTVKPTDQFVMDHLFGTTFKPIFESGGEEYLNAVRVKAEAIIKARGTTGN